MAGRSKLSETMEEDNLDPVEEAINASKKGAKEKVQFDFNKYKIANRTVQKTLEIDNSEFTVTVKPLSWSKRNQILSKAMTWDGDGGTKFDGDTYVRECLKEMIIDAPWGKTSELFLMSIDERLGNVLETLVPSAFGTDVVGDVENLEEG